VHHHPPSLDTSRYLVPHRSARSGKLTRHDSAAVEKVEYHSLANRSGTSLAHDTLDPAGTRPHRLATCTITRPEPSTRFPLRCADMASNHTGPEFGHGSDGASNPAQAVDQYATMGQFSFAPATKTTVVTTTYTTTTTFPPLCVNAPGSLSERDPKDYPLAHVQAPESIRKFYFESGGELACFEEANAASDKVQEVCLFCGARDMPCSRGPLRCRPPPFMHSPLTHTPTL
jgi:hypothetical protein